MSMKRRQPGSDQPPRVVSELNGKRVKIGGYVVPLDFEATAIKEFLLVPFVGACIQSDRVPHREGCGQVGGGLHPRRVAK